MVITEHVTSEALVLTLRGELYFSSRRKFMKSIYEAIPNGHSHIIINLENVTCADDTVIGMLVLAYQKLAYYCCHLSLLNPSPSLKQHLSSMKFPKIIPIYYNLDEALERKKVPVTFTM